MLQKKSIQMVLLTSLILLANSVFAEEQVDYQKWQSHMKALSGTIVDAFPFLYSRTEFRKPQNREIILHHLENLSNTSHTLPVKSGELVIGAGPLLAGSRFGMSVDLNKAIDLFKANHFDQAQKLVHQSVYNCFACHAAHQVGPSFPSTNMEVMGIATPFVSEKAIVFGALREFGGALDFIEGSGFSSIRLKAPESDELVKTYLVLSVRTTQKLDRALAFIQRIRGKLAKSSGSKAILAAWTQDLNSWKIAFDSNDLKVMKKWFEANRKSNSGSSSKKLVYNILESRFIHNVTETGATENSKAETYLHLGQLYRAIDLAPLNALIKLYADACATATTDKKLVGECTKLSSTK